MQRKRLRATRSCCVPPRRQPLPGHDPIVEGNGLCREFLALLVTLAQDEDDIAGAGNVERPPDGLRSVGFAFQRRASFGCTSGNLLDDPGHGGDTQLPALLGPLPLGGTFAPLMKGRVMGIEVTFNN